MPVTVPPLVILLMTLFETVEPPKLDTLIPVTALVPPVIFENVFPFIVFVAPLPEVISVFSQPVIEVPPVTVTFEKLLLLFISVVPDGEFVVVV